MGISDFPSQTGITSPATPVLVAVPHAGRTYPKAMAGLARVHGDDLRPLEDRFADHLTVGARRAGHGIFVEDVARAWVDLNRGENEIDPAWIAKPHGPLSFDTSVKARGGLGVIPSRIQTHGPIWRAPLTVDDLTARIANHHRPWHSAISEALVARHAHFGVAVLIDLHSMPPVRDWRSAGRAPRIVIGDLHGQSAGPDLSVAMMRLLSEAGMPAARNHPYAGGHTLARHGRPTTGIHAIQIEVDRSLYLDADLDQPGAGLPAMQVLIARLAETAARLAALPIAAE